MYLLKTPFFKNSLNWKNKISVTKIIKKKRILSNSINSNFRSYSKSTKKLSPQNYMPSSINNAYLKNFGVFANNHVFRYPTPSNLTYFWNFGSLAGIALAIQIISGLFLTMHYVPDISLAFSSIEHIMRDVKHGWLIRYMHANGASFFFIVLYIHIGRGIYYQSYTFPRHWIWVTGIFIYLLTCATAFLGYVLPWGQMSFWGATVITNMVTVIPYIGIDLACWLWGGWSIDNPTLHRFFCLHYLVPFVIIGIVFLHLYFLHLSGSNNPIGFKSCDFITFAPNFLIKDFFGFMVYLGFFFAIISYYPNTLGHPDNYIKANSLKTPLHVVPEWYFLPFYAMLRCIPHKAAGIITMLGSIIFLLFLPLINRSIIKNPKFKPLAYRQFIILWFFNFIALIYLGGQPIHEIYTPITQVCTLYYFIFWVVYIPLIHLIENNELQLNLHAKKK